MPGYNDTYGRIITLEFMDVTIVNIYHCSLGPQTNPSKRLALDDLFYRYIRQLQNIRPVICVGDMDVPHTDADISPKRPWGIINFERLQTNFHKFLIDCSLKDTGTNKRQLTWYPPPIKLSQIKQEGMRVDYILTPVDMHVSELRTHSHITGSDHKPISLVLYSTKENRPTRSGPFNLSNTLNSIGEHCTPPPIPFAEEIIHQTLLTLFANQNMIEKIDDNTEACDVSGQCPTFSPFKSEDSQKTGTLSHKWSILVPLQIISIEAIPSSTIRTMVDTGSTYNICSLQFYNTHVDNTNHFTTQIRLHLNYSLETENLQFRS